MVRPVTVLSKGQFLDIFYKLYNEKKATLPSLTISLINGLLTRGYTTHDVDLLVGKRGFGRDATWDDSINMPMYGGKRGFRVLFEFFDELGHRCNKPIDVFVDWYPSNEPRYELVSEST